MKKNETKDIKASRTVIWTEARIPIPDINVSIKEPCITASFSDEKRVL